MNEIDSGRILLVAHEDSVRAIVRNALEHRGHRVETVIDGTDAIAILQRERFAIVVMDLILPRMNGYDVLAFLAHNNIGTPVILLSYRGDTFVAEAASDAVLAIFRKPIEVDLLADAANAVCAEISAGRLHPQRRRGWHDSPADQRRTCPMDYRIERTYLTAAGKGADRVEDTNRYIVPAGNAHAAAMAFITHERAKLLGGVSEFPGDKSVATAARDGRVFTVFVERATDAICERRRAASEESRP